MEFYYHGLDEDVLVLAADGGLNHATAEQFVGSIENLVDAGLRKIVVDCRRLTFISSYGIGVILRLHKRLKKHGGDVKVCNLAGPLVKVLKIAHLEKIFDIYPDVDRAVVAFRPKESK